MVQPPPLPGQASSPLNYQPPKQWDKLPLSLPAAFSVILALLLPILPFVSGIVAVLLAVKGLKQTRTGEYRGRLAAKWGMGLGVVNIVLGPVLIVGGIVAIQRARDAARDVATMSNLRQIGIGVHMYANENKGYFPRTLDDVSKYMGGRPVFISPRGTPGQPVVQLKTGGSDYVYAPPADRITKVRQSSTVPIAYEPPKHFDGAVRAPVLFADGHTEMVKPPALYPLLQIVDNNAAAGSTPPAPPTP